MVGKYKLLAWGKAHPRSGVVIVVGGVQYRCLKLSVVATTLAEQQIWVCMCVQGSLYFPLMACSEVNVFMLC